jgi:glutathione synthase/RimK-type ligase-like ATP-grasp enzyme
MNILLLGTKQTSENNENYYQEYVKFFEEAGSHVHQQLKIDYCMLEELLFTIGDGDFSIFNSRRQKDIKDYDFVMIRGSIRAFIEEAKAVSIYLKLHKKAVVNDYSNFRSSSKLIQALQFQINDLPVAKTILLNDATLGRLDQLPFSYPCIMKATYGAHGNNNYLVESPEVVRQHLADNPDIRFVLQRFVPNDGDYRILVIDEETLVIKRSGVAGSHLNNTSQGGTADVVATDSLPAVILEQARKIVKYLDLTIAGVDVVYDPKSGDFSFLEVNAQPQLMSGAFVSKKAAMFGDYLKKLAA